MIKRVADLFCGAGGTSTGILAACRDLAVRSDLLAVNHWDTAINTHSLNHPEVRHLCESLDNISPQRAVSGGHLHLLAASPECTHHSNAAGGRPKNDQSRATAWHVCRWAADLRVDNILIENVREFINWGPLNKRNKPIKRRKGETFQAFITALRSMGYNVDWRVANAADFGDPTSRQRLIVIARRNKAVIWPEATHGPGRLPHRTAREIIDWQLKGRSIFNRKRPLSQNTLRRIIAGIHRFGGKAFVINVSHGSSDALRSVDEPLFTITTAKGGELAICEPFLVKYYSTGGALSLNQPLDTITTKARFGLVETTKNDVLFRMLVVGEYSAAQSFPASYRFAGTIADQIKQIGNAVPVQLARAHARVLLA